MSAQTFEVLTLFPDAVGGFVQAGLLGKAIDRGLVAVHCTDIRAFTTDRHRTVDDTPFGGGAGMVIKPEPVVAALESVVSARGPMHRILLTPSAPKFDQGVARRLAALPRIALLCGRYEGIDDRVREHFVDECLSLGDFVLGGGEVAALAVIEAVSRLHPGVLGNPQSVVTESFSTEVSSAMLEHPQYTRPAEFRGHRVPDVLLGGNHGEIERWRVETARRRTWALRPELRRGVSSAPTGRRTLAIPAGAPIDAEWIELARRHDVDGIALVGAEASEKILAWARALAGKVSATGFPNLSVLCKRLRRSEGAAPFVVEIARDADLGPVPLAQADEVWDTLAQASEARGESETPSRPLVVWFPGPEATDVRTSSSVAASARFSPGERAQLGLATAPGIADPSRPQFVAWVDAVLARLVQPRVPSGNP